MGSLCSEDGDGGPRCDDVGLDAAVQRGPDRAVEREALKAVCARTANASWALSLSCLIACTGTVLFLSVLFTNTQ